MKAKKIFTILLATLVSLFCLGAALTIAADKSKAPSAPSTPELVYAKNSARGKITVKWKDVKGATGYQISYMTGATTNKVNVKDTTEKTFVKVLANLVRGKSYTVKVRAYKKVSGKTYYSAWSKSIKVKVAKDGPDMLTDRATTKDVQAPYLPSILSVNDKGIQVYWRQPEISDGYEVFRSYKENGDYYYVGDCHEWSYFDTTFDKTKKIVYYRVCNYVYDKKGNRIYSEFTKVLTANYREELVISRSTNFLPSGGSREIEALYGWGNAKNIVWSSSDTSIATVDSTGRVLAKSKGICTISAYSKDLNVTKTAKLIVDREPLDMLGAPAMDYKRGEDTIWRQIGYKPENAVKDSALLMFAGDLMCMGTYQSAFRLSPYRTTDLTTDPYNFNECYTYVKDILSSADYTFGNLETVIDSTMPYSCDMGRYHYKPNCNAPSTFLDALVNAGFDGVALANNHSADADIHGVTETIKQCDRYNLGRCGMQTGTDISDRYLLTEVNGIKIGYLSYCTSLNSQDEYWTQEDLDTYQNRYEKKKAEADVKRLKKLGAEYIIVYIHWGTKNCLAYNDKQKTMAKELADMGVDYIMGSHPHVLQSYEEIKAADGRVVPCIYSLGDFNSDINQINGNRDTIILRIRLERAKDGSIKLVENNYIPCYTYTNVGGVRYATVPLNYKLTSLTNLHKYDAFRKRIAESIGDKLTEYQP